MVKVSNLTKRFGDVAAVDDVSFEIKPGEIVGLLGPNGAGKTTTMRLITGYLAADGGNAEVEGVSVGRNPVEVRKMIGYLPENNPLYKDMLVIDLLNFSAKLKGVETDGVVESTGITEVLGRRVGELSKGYKQRVGLALALLGSPKLLILDEPAEGLDPNQRVEMRTLIKKLSKHQSILVSTHVLSEVEALVDRVVVLSRGKVVADEPLAKLGRVKGRQIYLEVQGKYVETVLKKFASEVKKNNLGRYEAVLVMDKKVDLRPEISRLAAKNSWVIWEIREIGNKLENVFAQLTA